MSANNQLLIKKTKQGYIVKDICIEGGTGEIIFVAQNLETAIKKANKYMEKNIVEYGLSIQI